MYVNLNVSKTLTHELSLNCAIIYSAHKKNRRQIINNNNQITLN